MISLHKPVLHFHIGAWAITALTTFLAFWINFAQKRDLFSPKINKFIGTDIVVKLDYVAHISGIIGLLGIILAIYTGWIDATGRATSLLSLFDFGLVVDGIRASLDSKLLSFKMLWTFIGIQIFFMAGVIRLYFVTYKKSKSVYEEPFLINVIYTETTLVAYTIITIVGAVGGLYSSGHTIVADIPIIKEFLPGGNLLIIFLIFSGIFAFIIILGTLISDKKLSSRNINIVN